jgi:sugar lactone lactonase YvrE
MMRGRKRALSTGILPGLILASAVLLAAIAAAQNAPPAVAFRLAEKDLVPEGITHDVQTGRFFLGSIRKEKVVAVDGEGRASDFILSGRDGLMEGLGLKVDPSRRRLWVLSNKDIDDRHLSAVHVFNVDSGTLLRKFVLDDKVPRLFNDLVLTREGGAYVTDTNARRIYFVPGDLGRLELFLESKELLEEANGIVSSPDGALLYVAASKHIALVEVSSKAIRPIDHPAGADDSGIDGLCYHRGDLVAVVNGVKTEADIHIARFALGPDGRRILGKTVIDKGNPLFNIPTTAVIVGDDLYCLADTCLGVFLRNQMDDPAKLSEPTVLRYRLNGR